MRPIRRGDQGGAVAEIRTVLHSLQLLPANGDAGAGAEFDEQTELAVRAFQQSRGLSVDGRVGEETWRALDAARWRLGARTLYHALPDPLIGDDVRQLQERLLEMGYDVGRADAIYGARTARAVATFQREVGLSPDGACGPQTMNALRRLGRKVIGGAPAAPCGRTRSCTAVRTGPGRQDHRDRPGARRAGPRRGRTGRAAPLDRGRPRLRPGAAGWRAGWARPGCGCT